MFELWMNWQPNSGSQLSTPVALPVQMLLSLQVTGGPPTQFPPEQRSLDVQALLSLHVTVLLL